jgi:hypothetical protein
MMHFLLQRLKAILAEMTRPEPVERPAAETDWLPPVISAADVSSPYFLAMADREAAWYFDRR